MNLLARNWAQVKYSDEVFAIGTIVKSGSKNEKGYYNKSKFDVVDGIIRKKVALFVLFIMLFTLFCHTLNR